MFKKLLFTVVLLFLLQSYSNSQDFEIGIWTGVGSYQMGDLKDIQNQLLDDVAINGLKATESFPIYFNMGFNYIFSNYELFFRYESTGARLAYSDYSGAFFYDQTARNYIIGGSARLYYKSKVQKQFAPFLLLKSGISITNVEFSQSITIDSETISDDISFAENSLFLEPGIGVRWKYKSILIDPILSIFVPVFREGLHLEGDEDAKLQNADGDVHANWLGFRAGINFSVSI